LARNTNKGKDKQRGCLNQGEELAQLLLESFKKQ